MCHFRRRKRLRTRSVGSLVGLLGALGLCAVLASSGCGHDDTGAAASLMSCNAYCDTYAAAVCPTPLYPDVDMCKKTTCSIIPAQPAVCQAEIKAYYDCMQAQADVCAHTNCPDELDVLLACN